MDGSAFTLVQSQANASGIQVLETGSRDSNDNDFNNGREIQLEVNTTGNTSILGIRYRYQLVNQLT